MGSGSSENKKVDARIALCELNLADLVQFFDDYCFVRGIALRSARAHRIWWAMFYRWKYSGVWIDVEGWGGVGNVSDQRHE